MDIFDEIKKMTESDAGISSDSVRHLISMIEERDAEIARLKQRKVSLDPNIVPHIIDMTAWRKFLISVANWSPCGENWLDPLRVLKPRALALLDDETQSLALRNSVDYSIKKSKHILFLVDEYVSRLSADSRTNLRKTLMEDFNLVDSPGNVRKVEMLDERERFDFLARKRGYPIDRNAIGAYVDLTTQEAWEITREILSTGAQN